MFVIYELDTTGINGAYEATGQCHWYCTEDHANRDAIAEGYRSSANFSKPTLDTSGEASGNRCEWCGIIL